MKKKINKFPYVAKVTGLICKEEKSKSAPVIYHHLVADGGYTLI